MSFIRVFTRATILLAALGTLSCGTRKEEQPPVKADTVTINTTMAERGVDWLDLINSGADHDRIRDFFMSNVAPTAGCRSIIHHWARFTRQRIDLLGRG